MGSRYTEKAVDALADRLTNNFATQCRTVETAAGISSGALTNPAAIIKARVHNDNRSPLLQVYEERFDFIQQRQDFADISCQIVLTFTGDADLAAGQLKLRRYTTALIECVASDPTLNQQVTAAIVQGGDTAARIGDDSTTRHALALDVEVRVNTP